MVKVKVQLIALARAFWCHMPSFYFILQEDEAFHRLKFPWFPLFVIALYLNFITWLSSSSVWKLSYKREPIWSNRKLNSLRITVHLEERLRLACLGAVAHSYYTFTYFFISCGRQRGPILILVGVVCGRIERGSSGNAFRMSFSPCNVLSPLVS